MKSRFIIISKLFLNILSLFFCAYVSAQENVGKTSQGLTAAQSGLWPSPTCNVCWENPSTNNANERSWVRDAIRMTWEKESNFRFTGWGTCNANSDGIRIKISDERPHVQYLGTGIDGMKEGMVLNFTFKNWSPSCQSDLENCIRKIAVHEFGHALGFAHEQNRTDAPLECQKDAQGTDGDWFVTKYDEQSIMNYCNPKWNNDGLLSERDIYGVVYLYGGRLAEDPIIYLINNNSSKLLWYKHAGYMTATPKWAENTSSTVGTGWGELHHVINNGNGFIYAVKKNGDLVWYNHTGLHDGTFNWSQKSGTVIKSGFWNNEIAGILSGGKGVLYVIKKNGDLLWYKHSGYQDGSKTWAANSGAKVGSGWSDFHMVFSGGDGVIYLIRKDGSLYWYKHTGNENGTMSWRGGSSNKIGDGWNSSKTVFSTGGGNIYLVDKNGKLKYYRHDGILNGNAVWRNGSGNIVGTGWSGYSTVSRGTVWEPFTVLGKVKKEATAIDTSVMLIKNSNVKLIDTSKVTRVLIQQKTVPTKPVPPVETIKKIKN